MSVLSPRNSTSEEFSRALNFHAWVAQSTEMYNFVYVNILIYGYVGVLYLSTSYDWQASVHV